MQLRTYAAADLAACLAVFDSNVPKFFAPHERAEFGEFLMNSTDPYFVVTDEQGQVIGCGGYYINRERAAAGLTWGMVDRRLHRQGVGRFLLWTRLQRIAQEPGVTSVLINTSQHSYGFFEKVGFVVASIVADGFAAGLDEYKMVLHVTDEVRQTLHPPTEVLGN